MNRWWILGSMLATLTASAVELQQATNQELLNELARRLGTSGGGTGPAASVFVSYTCDSYGYLNIETLTTAAKTQRQAHSVGNERDCQAHLPNLNQFKTRVFGGGLQVAACDTYGYLTRYLVTDKGDIKRASQTSVGNLGACMPQANGINSQP